LASLVGGYSTLGVILYSTSNFNENYRPAKRDYKHRLPAMRVVTWQSAAALLVGELTSAKELLYVPRGYRRRDLDGEMRRSAFEALEGGLHRRQSSSSNTIPSTQSITDMNATIATACIDALSGVTSVSNQAGITACYNVLQHDLEQKMFQADLRLYLAGDPAGPFSNIEPGNMMIGVTYPPSTSFSSLMKRSVRPQVRQTSGMTEMQQYTLMGSFTSTMDMSKLNTTELMSLMVPQISINAVDASTQTPISTNISATTDMVYFVIGEFAGQFSDSIISPELQQVAIQASSQFILPGTTFGIFPVGLIVTTAWMLLFFLAFGLGTLGRIRHRRVFRARKAAVGGRIGKRF
jgi:hypothetical protein